MRNKLYVQVFFAWLIAIGGCVSAQHVQAQDYAGMAVRHVQQNSKEFGLSAKDVSDLQVTDATYSKASKVQHIYMRQGIDGIGIYKSDFAVHLNAEGKVVLKWVSGVKDAHQKANTFVPGLSALQAMEAVATHHGWPAVQDVRLLQKSKGADESATYSKGNLSQEDIPVRLMFFQKDENSLRLAWDLSILTIKGDHWWSLKVDALTGEVLEAVDWMSHCKFDHNHAQHSPLRADVCDEAPASELPPPPNSYNVYPGPIESPSYGARSIVSNPWVIAASPFGWHDTNGASGAEYTITRGNNVWAQEDQNGDNGTGTSPSGGATLNFDFPLNLNAAPSTYTSAALTNLFFWNNRMHDLWYMHGFDEVSGNFQQNNYGNGGAAADYVLADGQDGSGIDNANFSTPPDGTRPRMQMYLWTGQQTIDFVVNTPPSVAGPYFSVAADFGPSLPVTPITADLVLVNDGTASPTLGCNALTNAASISGKIALIDRGTCTFVNKVQNAQNAGAVACVVCNNVAGTPIIMGGTSGTITIPSVMISQSDCALLKAVLGGGVNVSLSSPGLAYDRDGDFDNGVIAHEYGHGISTRLTGGPANSNCLNNAEQMGEGWSDWFGLMMTMETGDQGGDIRGIGTYVIFEPTNGTGIRPAPYTTNMAINGYTYIDIQNTTTISSPHGIGFLWCNMLWEMTWLLVDQYGFDPNLETGTGGNNIAMKLVVEGLKLQPCSPGFVDGRNAILEADTLLYAGQYSCLIWEAFAKRGLGVGASQGSSGSRSDGTQSFTRPSCAVANFSAASTSACQGASVSFTDQSAGAPSAWSWNFGDGGTSTLQNPSHVYNSPGTYTVTLVVTSGGSNNTMTRPSYITIHPNPSATAAITNATCGNSNGSLIASGTGGLAPYSYAWSNGSSTATASNLAPGNYTVTVTDARGCSASLPFSVANQSGPAAGISSVTPASCGTANGAATANATGGTPPLSYAWSNGGNTATISNVAAGAYTVTVTDLNGCTSTATASISNSSGPSIGINASTSTTCGLNNGSATAAATGGTGTLTYSWSNGASGPSVSNLAPNTYNVTVTDQASCIAVTSVVIGASTPPTATISSSTPATCGQDNGSITASALNGTAPYSYSWSNGGNSASINNLQGGFYAVTVTDSMGCTDSSSITLAAYTQPAATVVAADLTCYNANNGTVTANPSGGNPPYTYHWNTGQLTQMVTGLPIGMYLVTVTDANGCSVVAYGVVNQPLQISGFFSVTDESAAGASDGSATANPTGGTPPYTYTWSNGGNTATIGGLSAGMYTVTVLDALGCEWVDSVEVGLLVSTDIAQEHSLDLWPNPNNGHFEMEIALPYAQALEFRVYNALGQVMEHRSIYVTERKRLAFDFSHLAAGVYQVQVSGSDFRSTKKLVITHY